MELVALVNAPDHVSCRYRLAAFADTLTRAGHSLALRGLPKYWWRRAAFYPSLRGANVVIQRRLLARWEIALLRRWTRRLIFDFDDAIFLRSSSTRKGHQACRRLRRFAATVTACDAVVAGNAFLAEQAARWCRPDRVRLIPTCVDAGRYAVLPKASASDGKELVWIGSSSTLKGLERAAPLLESSGRAVPGLRLRVICDRAPRFEGVEVRLRPWTAAGEAADLAAADIGISWVPDDPWSRGKCGLKILQYMAAGLPVIANPVGVHPELVRHGETGFLATTADEWRDAVVTLSSDATLRRTMGEAARRRCEERYVVPAGGRSWLDLINSLA